MGREGIKSYYKLKIEELETIKNEKVMNLRRLEAQRNELNTKGNSLPLSHAQLQEILL